MIEQRAWRKVATTTLILSAVMATYAVSSDMAHDSIIHFASLASQHGSSLTPLWACLIFWAIFSALMFTTLFIALLDFRYIRMTHAMEKRALLQKAIENEPELQKILAKVQQEDDTESKN
jgi:hypothetical protein